MIKHIITRDDRVRLIVNMFLQHVNNMLQRERVARNAYTIDDIDDDHSCVVDDTMYERRTCRVRIVIVALTIDDDTHDTSLLIATFDRFDALSSIVQHFDNRTTIVYDACNVNTSTIIDDE